MNYLEIIRQTAGSGRAGEPPANRARIHGEFIFSRRALTASCPHHLLALISAEARGSVLTQKMLVTTPVISRALAFLLLFNAVRSPHSPCLLLRILAPINQPAQAFSTAFAVAVFRVVRQFVNTYVQRSNKLTI